MEEEWKARSNRIAFLPAVKSDHKRTVLWLKKARECLALAALTPFENQSIVNELFGHKGNLVFKHLSSSIFNLSPLHKV